MTWAYEQDWCFGNTKEDEPKVILTVKEAKMLEDMALRWMFLNPKNVTLKSAQLMKQFSERIAKAEKGDE